MCLCEIKGDCMQTQWKRTFLSRRVGNGSMGKISDNNLHLNHLFIMLLIYLCICLKSRSSSSCAFKRWDGLSSGLTDWGLNCSSEDFASADWDEERVPLKDKSLNFLLPSSTWSWGAGHDWKNKQPKLTSIWNKLRAELLLCFIEWSQMKRFGHLIRMYHWKQTMGRPRTCWVSYIVSGLGMPRYSTGRTGERDVWVYPLDLLPLRVYHPVLTTKQHSASRM